MSAIDGLYKPRHVHLERHPGSSTGGVSQINFGAGPLTTQEESHGRSNAKGRGEFAARNEASSLFKTDDLASSMAVSQQPRQQQREPMEQRKMVPPGGYSSLQLGSEPAAGSRAPARTSVPEQASRTQAERSTRNPVLGVGCQTVEYLGAGEIAHGLPQAASRQDHNRSSIDGGIFGHSGPKQQNENAQRGGGAGGGRPEESMSRVPSNRRDPNEMSSSKRVGSKRVVDGFVEYCA